MENHFGIYTLKCTFSAYLFAVTESLYVDLNILLQDPQLFNIRPMKGPIAGGTKITINGTQLQTGARKHLNVLIGTINCLITRYILS